jgi:hypothetical protein
MTLQKGGAVVDFILDNKPRCIFLVVRAELLEGDLSINAVLDHLDLLDFFHDSLLDDLTANLLTPVAIRQIATFLLDSLHPATRYQGRLCGMLKQQRTIILLVDDNPEPGIIHHT